jgi:hypothetical protein
VYSGASPGRPDTPQKSCLTAGNQCTNYSLRYRSDTTIRCSKSRVILGLLDMQKRCQPLGLVLGPLKAGAQIQDFVLSNRSYRSKHNGTTGND